VYKDQLMTLGIIPCDPDSAAKAFADLKTELDKEKITRKAAQIEVDMLARAVKDLKISTDKFAVLKFPLSKIRLNTYKTRWWMG
jgi:hypothetical protein